MFPTTQISAIAALRGADRLQARDAWARVIAAYWRPVYLHLRLKWGKPRAEAQDLTQSFFAVAFEHEYLGTWEPARARFRSFLKVCVDRFSAHDTEATSAAKRGGGVSHIPIDVENAEQELATQATPDIETVFEREWRRSVFTLALDDLRANAGGNTRFEVFEAYDLADPDARPTYEALAARFDVPVTTITNHLAFMRRQLKSQVLQRLRELTMDDAELREEARALLGPDA